MPQDFLTNPAHPEDAQAACTAPMEDATPLTPAVDRPSVACCACYASGAFRLYLAPREDPHAVAAYRGASPTALSGGGELCRLPAPIRSLSICVDGDRTVLFALSDQGYFLSPEGAVLASFPLEAEYATVFIEEGRTFLLAGGRRMAYDWDTGTLDEVSAPLAALPFRLNDQRFDTLYTERHTVPGRLEGSLAKIGGEFVYCCADPFFRCGRENIDTFLCVAPTPEGPYSRRYLLLPNGRAASLFEGADGACYAVYIGSTPHSAVYEKPAIVRLSRMASGFLRPDERYRYESGPVDRLRPVPNGGIDIRDPYVYHAPDGYYYLTGTTAREGGTFWKDTNGILLWRSKDLAAFEPLGVVYDYLALEDTWQRRVSRAGVCWAPEIHFYGGTYWITYSTAPGCGLLRSASGEPQGPYEDMGRVVMRGIDSGFFLDQGVLYLVWQNGWIAPLDEDGKSFREEPRLLLPIDGQQVGYEGAGILKIGGQYVLYAAEWNGDERIDGTYDMMYSVSDSLYGPYSPRRVLIPHGGHGCLFDDREGRPCYTLFGNDRTAPFSRGVGIGRLAVDRQDGTLSLSPEV